MKLFVWAYSFYGIAFAIANSREEAIELLRKKIPTNIDNIIKDQPEIHELNEPYAEAMEE